MSYRLANSLRSGNLSLGDLLLCGLMLLCANAWALDPNQVQPSVVRVLAGGDSGLASGSGFVLNRHGQVLTNWHVVAEAEAILVIPSSMDQPEPIRARLLFQDPQADLAVLATDGLKRPPLPLVAGSNGSESMQTVYAWGFPGAGLDQRDRMAFLNALETGQAGRNGFPQAHNLARVSVSEGRISRLLHTRWRPDGPLLLVIQHTAAISGGHSGGPLVNHCGQVVGINTAIAQAHLSVEDDRVTLEAPHGLYYAQQIAGIIEFLRRSGVQFTTKQGTCATGEVIGKRWWLALALAASTVFLLGVLYTWGRRPVKSQVTKPSPLSPLAHLAEIHNRYVFTTPVPLPPDKTLILGRAKSLADWICSTTEVSRRHVGFFWHQDQWWLEDLNSQHGTRLNGQGLSPYQPRTLRQGDRLALGGLEFVWKQGSPTQPPDQSAQEMPVPTRTTCRIGRSPGQAQIVLNDDSISKLQLEIVELADGRYYATDCGSTNGSHVWRDHAWHPLKQDFINPDAVLSLGEVSTSIRQLVIQRQPTRQERHLKPRQEYP